MLQGINHITFEVEDLHRSIKFYEGVLGASLTAIGESLVYFDLGGIWVALNMGRTDNRLPTYDHVAFTADPEDLILIRARLRDRGWPEVPDRSRSVFEKPSLYVRDPDGHLLEFHTGSHQQRLKYLRKSGLPIRVMDE